MMRGFHTGGHVEEIVGLDMSDGEITAARVDVSPLGAVRLRNVGWTRVEAGASDKALAAAIKGVWKSAGLASHTIAASMRSRSVVVRPFSYPPLGPEELRAVLRLEAEESLQLPPDQIAADWHVNEGRRATEPGQKGRPITGLLVAAPLKEVERQQHILRMAGLYPVVFDLGATALANLFQIMHGEPKACDDVCVVHLSRQSADVAILFEGDGLYARTLYARGESWDGSLAALVEGLQDALKYYVFKLRGQPVRKMVVTGCLPAQSHFLNLVQARTDVPVERWDPVERVRQSDARVRRRLGATHPPLAIAMGLSLRRYAGD